MANSLTSITQLSRAGIEQHVDLAIRMSRGPSIREASGRPIIALLFFEESTRTRVGFETAAYRMGYEVVLVNEVKFHERMSRAESLEDTVRSIQAYCDILCLRHPDRDVFDRLQPIIKKPIINCGNGDDEHPTQSLIDLMTIRKELNRLDDLTVTIVGDLRFSRAAHSLVLALSKFRGIKVRAISPKKLRLPEAYKQPYIKSGNNYTESDVLDLSDADVVYVAGFPPRLPSGEYSQQIREKYMITRETAKSLKNDALILCPLPRIDEITTEVDDLPQARYFEQNENGLTMRMAILSSFLS